MDDDKTIKPKTKKKKILTATQKLIGLPVDLKELLDNLDLTEESVAVAARNQPRLYLSAHRYYVKKFRARLMQEQRCDLVEADTNLKIRWHDKDKGEKRTEPYVKALVARAKSVHEAKKVLADAQVEELWAKGLTEAYRQRNFAIRAVVDMLNAEVVLENRMSPAQVKDLSRMKGKLVRSKPQSVPLDDNDDD